MPKSVRSKTQAKKDREQLRKLRDLGLYTGKIDGRKAPTKSQARTISKFKDVLTGKAVAVKPKHPERFKGVYDVKGKTVIIPRRKGERITVDKSGDVRTSRKIGRKLVKGKGITRAKLGEFDLKDGRQYAIPFNRGGGEIHWMTFESADALRTVMMQYAKTGYKDWESYAVEIDIEDDPNEDSDLSDSLERKIERRRGRKLKTEWKRWHAKHKRKRRARGR